MIFTSNSKAFVQSTLLPESFKLKLFSCKIRLGAYQARGVAGRRPLVQIFHEKRNKLQPFWQRRLPHELFNITSEEHAVQSTSLPEGF